MKKIAVITSTRAEFGLLLPLIQELNQYENNDFKVDLVVTGTHLSQQYGYTADEIEKSGLQIDYKISIPCDSRNACDISRNQAETLISFTDFFLKKQYNAIVIVGDRYEMLAIAVAAGNTHTPIVHLCGGDTTEGAIDEWIRHSITKMSYLHFPTNEQSYQRILQLGESPERVFNYGSTSIDNILRSATIDKVEALRSLGLEECRYAICTYHPVTMNNNNICDLIGNFLEAIKSFPDITFIITKANADQGGEEINRLLEEAEQRIDNVRVFASLGVTKYLSLMKSAEFVLGNSSSGIIETPSFGIPTINIGDRQRGRLQAKSIINCEEDADSIKMAINRALQDEFRKACKEVLSPYGDGCAAEKIAKKIHEVFAQAEIDLKKSFYISSDIE